MSQSNAASKTDQSEEQHRPVRYGDPQPISRGSVRAPHERQQDSPRLSRSRRFCVATKFDERVPSWHPARIQANANGTQLLIS